MVFYKNLYKISEKSLFQLYKLKSSSNSNINNRIIKYSNSKEKMRNYKIPNIYKQNSIILYNNKSSDLLSLDDKIKNDKNNKNNKNDKNRLIGGFISATTFYIICYSYIFSKNIELLYVN